MIVVNIQARTKRTIKMIHRPSNLDSGSMAEKILSTMTTMSSMMTNIQANSIAISHKDAPLMYARPDSRKRLVDVDIVETDRGADSVSRSFVVVVDDDDVVIVLVSISSSSSISLSTSSADMVKSDKLTKFGKKLQCFCYSTTMTN